jgi:hypothetical protein
MRRILIVRAFPVLIRVGWPAVSTRFVPLLVFPPLFIADAMQAFHRPAPVLQTRIPSRSMVSRVTKACR